MTINRLFFGETVDRLLEADTGFQDGGVAIAVRAESDPLSPSGPGGESIFAGMTFVLEHSMEASVVVTPIVDGVTLETQTIVVTTARTIATSSVANPTVITTTTAHGLQTGEQVRISGHTGSTPSLNGDHIITVTGATTFTIPVNVTVGGTDGTLVKLTRTRTQVELGLSVPILDGSGVEQGRCAARGTWFQTLVSVAALAAGDLILEGFTVEAEVVQEGITTQVFTPA